MKQMYHEYIKQRLNTITAIVNKRNKEIHHISNLKYRVISGRKHIPITDKMRKSMIRKVKEKYSSQISKLYDEINEQLNSLNLPILENPYK